MIVIRANLRVTCLCSELGVVKDYPIPYQDFRQTYYGCGVFLRWSEETKHHGTDSYVRAIYARVLSRPDPRDIAQPLSWTVTGNGTNRYAVTFDNANLKAETGDDIDVLHAHYFPHSLTAINAAAACAEREG